jgi:rhamnose transport system permease protein
MTGRFWRELSVGGAWAVLLIVLAVVAPTFYDPGFLAAMVTSKARLLVVAVGMTLVILARQIDISIAAQFSICGVAAGLLAREGVPLPAIIVLTLLVGAALGSVNGGLVAGLGLPSIVVTLATWVIFREALRWGREGESVRDLPDSWEWFGLGQLVSQGWAQLLGQLLVLAITLVVFLAFALGLRFLAAGRAVYATGSDPEAARLAGIRPRRVVFGVFVTMGALTALAALLNYVQFRHVDPNDGAGLELEAIAAVVVGGVAISGGRGTLVGTLLGVALLGTIGPALTSLKIDQRWEKAIQGLIILTAVAVDGLRRKG